MVTIEFFALLLLVMFAVVLAVICKRHGVPDMVSDCYYLTNQSILMPVMLIALGMTFLPVMIDKGGIDCMAFLTCAGLAFVGAAPAYLDGLDRKVHKTAAIVSAAASVIWAVSVDVLPTIFSALAAALAMALQHKKWLFWAEVIAIANVAATVAVGH